MYPIIFEEMERQGLSGRQLTLKSGLVYTTTFPKLSRGYGGEITLDEAIKIRRTLGVKMDLEKLFIKERESDGQTLS